MHMVDVSHIFHTLLASHVFVRHVASVVGGSGSRPVGFASREHNVCHVRQYGLFRILLRHYRSNKSHWSVFNLSAFVGNRMLEYSSPFATKISIITLHSGPGKYDG